MAAYGAAALTAYVARRDGSDRDNADELYIPVFGPIASIVAIEKNIATCRDSSSDSRDRGQCALERVATFVSHPVLVVDALLQAGGLVAVATGVMRTTPSKPAPRGTGFSVRPYATGSTLGLAGTF